MSVNCFLMLADVFLENLRLGALFLAAYFSLSVGFCLLSHSKHFGKIVFSKDALVPHRILFC